MTEPYLGVVIVNYNGANFQNKCVESILANGYENLKIIIVDNASTDNSVELLDDMKSDKIVKVLCRDNYGIAKGNNIGIEKSKELGCTYTLLLNNDTELPKDFFSKFFAKLNEGDEVAVPKIYIYGTDKLWFAGGRFLKLKCTAKHLFFEKPDAKVKIPDYCDFAPACCMLVKNTVFDEVGLMDENYFLYFDDTDFCFRLKLASKRIRLVGEAYMYHKVSLSTGGNASKISIYYNSRNRLYFHKKFKKRFSVFSGLYIGVTRQLKYFKGLIKKDNNVIIKRAISDYRKGLMGRADDL